MDCIVYRVAESRSSFLKEGISIYGSWDLGYTDKHVFTY